MEQDVTPDGFKVPLPKKLSGNQSAALQQESILAPEQLPFQPGMGHSFLLFFRPCTIYTMIGTPFLVCSMGKLAATVCGSSRGISD